MKYRFACKLVVCISLLFATNLSIGQVQAAESQKPAEAVENAHGPQEADVDKVARELSNPLTSLWSLNNEFDFQSYDGKVSDRKQQAIWFFKPVMPIGFGKDWIWVNRPTIPVSFKQPYLDTKSGAWENKSGLGDIEYLGLIGKNLPGGLVLAGGLTTIFPTATNEALGSGKWQAGPALVAAKLDKKYILGTLVQQWWSFAGQHDRPSTNLTAMQLFYFLNFSGGWQVGGTPIISADWKEDSENRFNVPVGLGVYKTLKLGKLPIKIGIEFQYSIIHEELFGRDYNIKFMLTPVIPALF